MTLDTIRSAFAFLDDWEDRYRYVIAILFAIYSGKTADDVLGTDGPAIFAELGLKERLTPQRSNRFAPMVERIRADARAMAVTRPERVRCLELQRS